MQCRSLRFNSGKVSKVVESVKAPAPQRVRNVNQHPCGQTLRMHEHQTRLNTAHQLVTIVAGIPRLQAAAANRNITRWWPVNSDGICLRRRRRTASELALCQVSLLNSGRGH
eukprot:s3967_g4.t1